MFVIPQAASYFRNQNTFIIQNISNFVTRRSSYNQLTMTIILKTFFDHNNNRLCQKKSQHRFRHL